MTAVRDVRLIDVTLRDAHQCLWATRMTTAMMRPMSSALDDAGFEAIDLVGGAVFDVCVRYLREDPWERMRILSEWIPKTPLIIHTRGQSLFTFEFFPDDVVSLSAERFAANGMRYHTPYDALNDIKNLEIPVTEAKRHGLTVVPGIVFTESPVHTNDYYIEKTKQVMALGVDGIFIKDPSGLLRPERATTLVRSMKAEMGDMQLQLHSHCLSGLAPYTALCAVQNGVEVLHTATAPLANGASHPSTQGITKNLRRMGYNIDIDLAKIDEVADVIKFIAAKEEKPLGEIAEYDAFHFHHQVAGGMISNLEYQLSTVGLADRLDDILQEAGNVRADLGYPIVVSPFAQYIITQSVLNVVAMDNGKERFSSVPDEVRLYVRGGYGEIAGKIDPNLYDRITKGAEPITQRPGELVPPTLKKARDRLGANASDDDVLLSVFYDEKEFNALKDKGPIDTYYPIMETPLKTLIKGITSRSDITSFHFIDRKNSQEISK